MIKFNLKCGDGHSFDSWFANSEAFDKLQAAHMVSCVVCGSTDVQKALMAPSVSLAEKTSESSAPLTTDQSPQERVLAEMRRQVEENADYVGMSFAKEARDMHDGVTPDRPIYGEANLKDAKALLDDGVPVAPLPFMNKRKVN